MVEENVGEPYPDCNPDIPARRDFEDFCHERIRLVNLQRNKRTGQYLSPARENEWRIWREAAAAYRPSRLRARAA